MAKPRLSNLRYLFTIVAVLVLLTLIGVKVNIVLFPGAYDTPSKIVVLAGVTLIGVLAIISNMENVRDFFVRLLPFKKQYSTIPQPTIIVKASGQRSEEEELWAKYSSSPIQRAVKDEGCAWVLPWSGFSVEEIDLIYDEAKRYDENNVSILARRALDDWRDDWRLKKPNRLMEFEKEPWGAMVRLEEVEYRHGTYRVRIHLSPTKFLYYVAIQRRLGENELRILREKTFRNALEGILNGERLELPSHFAIHMAVVSREHKAILRKRDNSAKLYPGAWEAGVGEFMHGLHADVLPDLRHFNEDGKPDLRLYLQRAVKEELNYSQAKPGDFRLYGFAIERQTLAPKMLVVYESKVQTDALLKGAKEARDRSPEVSSIELTPQGVAEALANPRYQTWGPTSKLALMLALTQGTSSESERSSMISEVKQNMAKLENGKKVLANELAKKIDLIDVIDLKPNFFGIGININKILKSCFKFFRRKVEER